MALYYKDPDLQEVCEKTVVGSIESVTLYGKNGTQESVEAKIDTGARMSSIDVSLAKSLGFGTVIDKFSEIDTASLELTKESKEEAEEELTKKYVGTIDGLAAVAVVFSASGVTIRPVIEVKYVLQGKEITSHMNFVNRSHMQYPMIVGKLDLGEFLVDVSR
jgi:hypothetical protein